MASNQVSGVDPTVIAQQRSTTNTATLAYNQLVQALAEVQANPRSVSQQELTLLAGTVSQATTSLQQAMSSISGQAQGGSSSNTLQTAYQQASDLLNNINSQVGRLNNALYTGGSNLRLSGSASAGYTATTVNMPNAGGAGVAASNPSLMSQGIGANTAGPGLSVNSSAVQALQGTPLGNILSAVVQGLVKQVQTGQLDPLTGQPTSSATAAGAGATGAGATGAGATGAGATGAGATAAGNSTTTASGAGGTGAGTTATSSSSGFSQSQYEQNAARNTESGGVAANPLLAAFFSFLDNYMKSQSNQNGGGSSNTKAKSKSTGASASGAGGTGGIGDPSGTSGTGGAGVTPTGTQSGTQSQAATGAQSGAGTQQPNTQSAAQQSGTQSGGTSATGTQAAAAGAGGGGTTTQAATAGTGGGTTTQAATAGTGGGTTTQAATAGTGGGTTTQAGTGGGGTTTQAATQGTSLPAGTGGINSPGTGGTTTQAATAGTGGTTTQAATGGTGDTNSATEGAFETNTSGIGEGSGVDNSGVMGNPLMGAANINGYIMAVLLECYKAGQQDLLTEAQNLQALNRAKDGVRAQLASARQANSSQNDPGGGNSAQVQDLEDQLTSMGDDAQLEQLNLQNLAQNQQQLLQMLSNFMKNTSDDSMAIIRHIGGG